MKALPKVGDVVSFSAGTTSRTRLDYRIVSGTQDRLAEALNRFPELAGYFGTQPPLVINSYPATLGVFPSAVVVDTYLRPCTFSRALALAERGGYVPVVLGQPLSLAELFRLHREGAGPMPRRLFVAVGGYYCPRSLEAYLRSIVTGEVVLLHAYGTGEVDFACLIGQRLIDGTIQFKHVNPAATITIDNGDLYLGKADTTLRIRTGDRICRLGAGYVITPGAERLSPTVQALLESWTSEWERYTGYLSTVGDRAIQLRPRLIPRGPVEVEHFEFMRQFGMTWHDKPQWSDWRATEQGRQ